MIEPIAYLNDKLIHAHEAKLSVTDLGVVFGAAVTEMLRTFHHQPFRIDEHLDRLFRSLRTVGFPHQLTPDKLRQHVNQVVEHNEQLLPPHHDLGIVIFVTPGHNLTYLGAAGRELARTPTVGIHTFPLPFELWLDRLNHGQHLITPSIRQIPPDSLSPRIKARNRLHWYLADREAASADPQATAVLLDHNGFLTETGSANLFAVIGGTILTPHSRSTLGGISQSVVHELAKRLQLSFAAADITPHELVNADEAFTSSTPTCLLPVTRFNHRPLGDGRPGPVFRQLLSAWSDLVGLDIARQIQQVAAERWAF
jgi:branched-chain amino acid aminotransferase